MLPVKEIICERVKAFVSNTFPSLVYIFKIAAVCEFKIWLFVVNFGAWRHDCKVNSFNPYVRIETRIRAQVSYFLIGQHCVEFFRFPSIDRGFRIPNAVAIGLTIYVTSKGLFSCVRLQSSTRAHV